jgi:hypothetical protein
MPPSIFSRLQKEMLSAQGISSQTKQLALSTFESAYPLEERWRFKAPLFFPS